MVVLDHLSDTQRRAYIIADNKLAMNAGWNLELLAQEVRELEREAFDLDLIGFSESEMAELLVIGDAVHSYALQFPHPEWTMAFDVNPGMAVTTRRKIFKDAAAARTTLMGYHLPFPGIGHARAVGSGYEWVPRPWVV